MYELEEIKTILNNNINIQPELIKYIIKNILAVKNTDDKLIAIIDIGNMGVGQNIDKIQSDITNILSYILKCNVAIILTSEKEGARKITANKLQLKNISKIIAIASGKGGVGKSTITRNLASALLDKGLKVGILDADILGPSQPKMLGFSGNAELGTNKKITPVTVDGIKTMSISYMLKDKNSPIVWRGPMLQKALLQMFRDVDWGNLDILLLDMPPGTGDVSLTIAQNVELYAAVIVSTPQDIALLDAIKSLEMFKKMLVKIAGIIENMSIFTCPNCGHKSEIFGYGGAKNEAKRLNVQFLGEIPLIAEIRKESDKGKIIKTIQKQYFSPIADKIIENLE